jgi:hypothetical protein
MRRPERDEIPLASPPIIPILPSFASGGARCLQEPTVLDDIPARPS